MVGLRYWFNNLGWAIAEFGGGGGMIYCVFLFGVGQVYFQFKLYFGFCKISWLFIS
jgi:hypothetical protein